MHPEDIKAALRKRYGSVRAFEAEKALPMGSTRDVLRGRSVTRTALAIAECLDKPLKKLFPGRFNTQPDNTSRKRDAHRLNEAAQ